jgi:hypothetical protein
MNDANTINFDQTEEETLIDEISDEALEAAAGILGSGPTYQAGPQCITLHDWPRYL